jgi:putative transposase
MPDWHRYACGGELLDEVLKEYGGPQYFEAIFKRFKKAVVERALGAELTQHLGYDKGEDKPEHQTNHRNGSSGKRILTDQRSLEIEVPRDRDSSFEPQLIKKGERRFSGFDDKIIAMYARGMTVQEIQGYLEEMYGVLLSPDLKISCTWNVRVRVSTFRGIDLFGI